MQYHVDNPETVFADPEAKTKPAAYRAELKDSFEWFVGKIASMTTIEVCERHIQDAVRCFILMGQALKKIRDNRLYERDWKGQNFQTYCLKKRGLSSRQVNNIIRASATALIVQKNLRSHVPNFSMSVWGVLGRYLLTEKELVEGTSDLAARYTDGATVAEAKKFLSPETEPPETEQEEPQPTKEEREMEETKRSLEEYDRLHQIDEARARKDDLGSDVETRTSLDAFKNDHGELWNTLMKKHGDALPVRLMLEVGLKLQVELKLPNTPKAGA